MIGIYQSSKQLDVSIYAGEPMTLAIYAEPHALSAGKPVVLGLK